MPSADIYKARLITGEWAPRFSVDNLVSINTGKTHVELIYMNECHFKPVIPVSSHGVSEPLIPCHEYLGGVID